MSGVKDVIEMKSAGSCQEQDGEQGECNVNKIIY